MSKISEETMFHSYIRPRPPKPFAEGTVIQKLPASIYGFVEQSARIRESMRHSVKNQFLPPRERIVVCGLAWLCTLLETTTSINMDAEGEVISAKGFQGRPSEELVAEALKIVTALRQKHSDTRDKLRPTVWYDGERVVASYRVRFEGTTGYFYVPNVSDLTPADIRIVGTFMQVFEDTLTTSFNIEFLQDQRRLLSRRTIAAQLRPNDLLYQSLRRLHKFIPWRRSSVIIAPVQMRLEEGGEHSDGAQWHIVAEKLWGKHPVSQRVGKRYYLGSGGAASDRKDFIVTDIKDFKCGELTPWQRLVLDVLVDGEGLAASLPIARSSLVLSLGGDDTSDRKADHGPDDGWDSPVIVLSDPRPGYFMEEHLSLARDFFSDIGQLLKRSSIFSHQLISLWTPPRDIAPDNKQVGLHPDMRTQREDADIVEALADGALAEVAPKLLSIDALQVVQLRRNAAPHVDTGRLNILCVRATEHGEGSAAEGAEGHVVLVDGVKPNLTITPEADILWRFFSNRGKEYIHKEAGGIAPERLANLFASEGRPYNTVLIVPIYTEGEVAGALIAYRRSRNRENPSEFIDVDKFLLHSVAARLGEFIELNRQLADRERLIICLSGVAEAASPSEAGRALVMGARELLNADHALMMAARDVTGQNYDKESMCIIDVAHTWADDSMYLPPINAGAEGITGEVYVTGETLAVLEVSSFPTYVPLVDGRTGEKVRMASELAVPIKTPVSMIEAVGSPVLGVLDAMWEQSHLITPREVKTLGALADHAGAVLQLNTSLDEARATRDKLNHLLSNIKALQSSKSDEEVWQWISNVVSQLIDYDVLVVWSHVPGSDFIEVVYVSGESKYGFREHVRLDYGQCWTGKVIETFRSSGLKSAIDRFDNPNPAGVEIPGTLEEAYQSTLAYCIVPVKGSPRHDGESPRAVWAVCLYRLRQSNFSERDESLLRLALEYCEGATQNLNSVRSQMRTLQLAAATRDFALHLVESVRTDPGMVIMSILKRVCAELGASNASVLYYHEVGGSYATPAHYAHPEQQKQEQAARPSGISETARMLRRRFIISDISNPPPEFAEPVKSSPFLSAHPEIRSMVGTPLYEKTEQSDSTSRKFCGVFYINFDYNFIPSEEELRFLDTVGIFLTECGGLEASLARMRERALQAVQTVNDPYQVFAEILKVAIETLTRELPQAVTSRPSFKIGGNVYMLTESNTGPRLRDRKSIGEQSGDHPNSMEIGEGVVGKVAQSGRARIISDTHSKQAEPDYVPYLVGMRSELAVPIILYDEDSQLFKGVAPGVIGVLNVECSAPDMFTARHERLLERFASESPVPLVLNLAERHRLLLWRLRREDDSFITDAAAILLHDLTKPMRQVASQAQEIREKLDHANRHKVEPVLQVLERESHRWQEIKETGFLHFHKDILESRDALDVIAQVRAWARGHEPRVLLRRLPDTEFYIQQGQRELLGRVLENLCKNSVDACKRVSYSKQRIWVTFRMPSRSGEKGQYLDVNFNDNGPGIVGDPDEIRSYIFRPFNRRRPGQFHPDRKEDDGHWGLGLSLVRQMMHLMGGDIEFVGSRPYSKTTFRLRFRATPV